MELELRQDYISCWETVCDTSLNLEETSEMIVPDACPDIMQVLDGEGKVLLQRKEAQDGRAEFSGLIKASILYLPDGDGKICSLDAVLPFSASVEAAAISRRAQVQVIPQVQSIDVHLLNPRKILIRVNFTLKVQCYAADSVAICPCVDNGEPYSIQQKVEDYQSHVVVTALEKMFNYSDVLSLPAGRPDIKKLLRTRADCLCNESKIIGSKLVFKGEARLEIMYSGQDDELYHANFTLPFSQIIECSDAGEEAAPEIQIIFTDLSCKLADEEGRSLAVELELLAQALLRKNERRELLTDLYSTSHAATPNHKQYPVRRVMDQGVAPESVREVLETGIPATNVLDVHIRPCHLAKTKQDNSLELGAEVEVFVLYTNEQGNIDSLHRKFIVPHQIPISDNWDYQCQFWISREGLASPVSSGIEVSFTIDFSWTATAKGELSGIDAVTLEERVKDAEKPRPSVILKTVRPGESLWEIAKAFCTTESEISEANALQSTELYPGQMLLLPKMQDRVC